MSFLFVKCSGALSKCDFIHFISVCSYRVERSFLEGWTRAVLRFLFLFYLLHMFKGLMLEKMSLSCALLFCSVKDDTIRKLRCALHVYGISYGEGCSSCLERAHGNYVLLLSFLFSR